MALNCFKEVTADVRFSIPEARSGHRCCSSDNYLYVFGGYNPDFNHHLYRELWCFNTTLERWMELPNSKRTPFECASSTVVLIRNSIFAFGGSGYPFGQTNSNKLLVYSLKRKEWFEIIDASSSNRPLPKYGHGMAYSSKNCKLYVYSGTTGRYFTDELHSFDLRSLKWNEFDEDIISTNSPHPRYRHEMVWDDDSFYVLGGGVLEHSFGFNEISQFLFDTNQWKNLKCQPCSKHGFPISRKAHASVLFHNCIYVIGGLNVDTDTPCDDVWKLELSSLQWTLTSIRLPEKLYFHSASVSSLGCLYVFGGVTFNEVSSQSSRTSSLHKVWLTTPPLVELVWIKLLKYFPTLKELSKDQLSAIGIPLLYEERFNPFPF